MPAVLQGYEIRPKFQQEVLRLLFHNTSHNADQGFALDEDMSCFQMFKIQVCQLSQYLAPNPSAAVALTA